MRATDAAAAESFVVVNVTRGEFAAFHEEHFHAHKHYGQGYNEACEEERFHRIAEILCKYMKGMAKFASKSILFCNLWCFS